MSKISTIYAIRCTKNNKLYVGFTNRSPTSRWKEHLKHFNKSWSGCQRKPLYRAMRKHGIENFVLEVIYQSTVCVHTQTVMETHFIRELKSHVSEHGYNLTNGGEGYSSCRNSKNYSRPHTEKTKEILRQFHLGTKASDETKEKMRKAKISRKHPQNVRDKMSLSGGRGPYRLCDPNGMIYDTHSLRAFALANGLQQSELSRVLHGKSKSHHGWTVISLCEQDP